MNKFTHKITKFKRSQNLGFYGVLRSFIIETNDNIVEYKRLR